MKPEFDKDKFEIERMIMNRDVDTFKLYARPSFWEGMARLIDVRGILNEYNYSHTEEDTDFKAILSDWENVGLDILVAIDHIDKELRGQSTDARP
jgi:hypothetical protein